MRVLAACVGVGALLGCAGLGGGAADEVEDVEDVGEAVGPDGRIRVLALHPRGDGCAWKVWGPDGKGRVLARSPACPTEILWSPDGSEVVYTTPDGTYRGPWGRKQAAERIAPPDWPTGGWTRAWIARDTGRLRQVALVPATVEERGGQVVFAAGDLAIPVVRDGEGWVSYGVRGIEVVAPGAGDRGVELPPWGTDQIAVFVEQGDDGRWTRLAALPTRWEAGDTPGDSVGGDLLRAADWPSLSDLRPACGKLDCEAPEAMAERADLQGALGVEGVDGVGFLAGDPGGVAFKLEWGDGPYPFTPVLSCADAECAAPLALEGLEANVQITVAPRGRYVLVAEHDGGHPRLYVQGAAAPVLALPDAVSSGWVPEGGLPRPRR